MLFIVILYIRHRLNPNPDREARQGGETARRYEKNQYIKLYCITE